MIAVVYVNYFPDCSGTLIQGRTNRTQIEDRYIKIFASMPASLMSIKRDNIISYTITLMEVESRTNEFVSPQVFTYILIAPAIQAGTHYDIYMWFNGNTSPIYYVSIRTTHSEMETTTQTTQYVIRSSAPTPISNLI